VTVSAKHVRSFWTPPACSDEEGDVEGQRPYWRQVVVFVQDVCHALFVHDADDLRAVLRMRENQLMCDTFVDEDGDIAPKIPEVVVMPPGTPVDCVMCLGNEDQDPPAPAEWYEDLL
jgi:hypothetical protein